MSFDPLAVIRSESLALADAADGNLAAPVEHCPGWTVADLVRHVYEVHAFWGQIVQRRLTDREQLQQLQPVAEHIPLDVYRTGVDRFIGILRDADPQTEVWTWSPQHDVAFVVRHQVQEAAVHRWDAENARGSSSTLDPDSAADAVEEFLAFSLDDAGDDALLLEQPLTLRATDAQAAWTLRPSGRRLEVTAGTADGNSVRGTAFDLLLLLYGRRNALDVQIDGDVSVLDALRSYAATD